MQCQIREIKKVIFENFTPFTNCISEIDNKQVDNAKDINIVCQCIKKAKERYIFPEKIHHIIDGLRLV